MRCDLILAERKREYYVIIQWYKVSIASVIYLDCCITQFSCFFFFYYGNYSISFII